MRVFFKGRGLEIKAKRVSFLRKAFGLMFRTRKTENLWFDFSKYTDMPITSWFVFFPFLVLWLDDKNRVLGFEYVKPFRFNIKPGKIYKKFVELPENDDNLKIIDFFVGKRKI